MEVHVLTCQGLAETLGRRARGKHKSQPHCPHPALPPGCTHLGILVPTMDSPLPAGQVPTGRVHMLPPLSSWATALAGWSYKMALASQLLGRVPWTSRSTMRTRGFFLLETCPGDSERPAGWVFLRAQCTKCGTRAQQCRGSHVPRGRTRVRPELCLVGRLTRKGSGQFMWPDTLSSW